MAGIRLILEQAEDCPDEDSYKYCVHGYQLGLFAEAFVWSGGLLDMAIDDRHVTADLATAIINVAARRNLTYFLQMYPRVWGSSDTCVQYCSKTWQCSISRACI